MVKKVVDTEEFHNRNVLGEEQEKLFAKESFTFQDFDVNFMGFTDEIKLSKPDGTTDYTFLSKDCFHLSQKGHSKFSV